VRHKLLALDVDGTLLCPGKKIGERTLRALAAAAEAGLRTILCTGRSYRSVLPIVRTIGVELNIVVNGGSLVKNLKTDATVYRHGLPPMLFRSLATWLKEHSHYPVVYLDTFPEQDLVVTTDREGPEFYQRYLRRAGSYRVSPQLSELPRDKILAIGLFGGYGEMDTVKWALKREFGRKIVCQIITFGRAGNYSECLEILSHGTSKWNALMHVAQEYGIEPRNIIAAGNDVNDLEMIRKAGIGVAVANAKQELKDAADFVIPSCDDEGVADLIEHLLE